jgi:Rrf2 family iron-sulfur cluster assembly transcriptional regulator
MNFTKTTSYSISILSYMAQHESFRMSASYLHNKLNIPHPYLRAVLGRLSRNNIVNGINGRNGGFRLSRDKSMIFLADIIETTEGLDSFSKCIMGFNECPFNYGCFMHDFWIKTRTDIIDLLKKTSLADLLTGKNITY